MGATVKLKKIDYRKDVLSGTFPLIREWKATNGTEIGTMVIDGTGLGLGKKYGLTKGDVLSVTCTRKQFVQDGVIEAPETASASVEQESKDVKIDLSIPLDGPYNGETEGKTIKRIGDRFGIVEDMTTAVADGFIRSIIVSGPPGVGKSSGIQKCLEASTMLTRLGSASSAEPFQFVRGSISPVGLYRKLWEFKEKGHVLVFDDCDDVFFDPISLSLLKASLDSTTKRIISWNKENSRLEREHIPERFEFQGSIIFITNLDFARVRSNVLKPHMDAIMSRCHYLSLEIGNAREKFLRIKGVVKECNMLEDYEFDDGVDDVILDFMKENVTRLNELSLRTVLKIADLMKFKKDGDWQRFAQATLMKKAK